MKKNMGTADRVLRILGVLVIAYLILSESLTGTLAIVLGIIGILLLLTAAVGVCPAYIPLKITSLKKAPN
jgi:hypothetical protein